MSKVNDHADIALINLICQELDSVKHRHHNAWSDEAEIELLNAQLNTYTFQLQQISQAQYTAPGSSENIMLKKSLIRLGFMVAARMIHTFSTMTSKGSNLLETQTHISSDGEDRTRTQRYLPKYYFIALSFAASFIFKATANFKERDSTTYEIAQNSIGQTYRMFSSWSDHKSDELGRAARMIEVLSHASDLSGLEKFDLRGGANLSILEHTMQTAKAIREGMEMEELKEDPYQYGTPTSIGADPASNLPVDTLSSWMNLDFGVVNELEFDWNLLGDSNITGNL